MSEQIRANDAFKRLRWSISRLRLSARAVDGVCCQMRPGSEGGRDLLGIASVMDAAVKECEAALEDLQEGIGQEVSSIVH